MASDAKAILENATESTEESERLQKHIEKLNKYIRPAVIGVDHRLEFAKGVPVISVDSGAALAAGCAIKAIEKMWIGGQGIIVLRGIRFQPITAFLSVTAPFVIGGLAIGTVCTIIAILWQRQQFNALE